MVFRSGSGSGSGYEAANSNINNAPGFEAHNTMIASGSASSTAIVAKSPQLLHSFSLPNNLKWSINHSPSSSRFRKLSLADSPSPLRENSPDPAVLRHSTQFPLAATRKDVPASSDQPQPQVDSVEEENSSGKRWNKIFLRLSNKNKGGGEASAGGAAVAVEDQSQTVVIAAAAAESEAEAEAQDSALKTWNFRPRKLLVKKQPIVAATSAANAPKGGNGGEGGGSDIREAQAQAQAQVKVTTGSGMKKEKKRKLSVSLSREEIEEDIYSMTGFKPSRRPKKRAKNVQKQLDSLFPGLWLSYVALDAYKVPDPPLKN